MSEYTSFNNTNGLDKSLRKFEEPKKPFLVNFLLKMGIAKNDQQANKMLIIAIIIIICVALLLTILSSQDPSIRTIHITNLE
ncbi:MAG: hypothetical protein K9M11_04015 [Candidatus Pacebacteria bacterium]|nr:hypothetical protein [Candidatus Paceibacterota bacterium]